MASRDNSQPPLLIIGIDGLRYDFIDPLKTPNLWQVAQEGAWAPNGMRCQFPSQTLPNFQSISTGLTVEHHGIIDNIMWDPLWGERFDYLGLMFDSAGSQDPKWQFGLPIWKAYEKAHPQHYAGSIYWPFGNIPPNAPRKVIHNLAEVANLDWTLYKTRIDSLIDWINGGVGLGLFYIPEPDLSEHTNDIFSEKITNIIYQVDELVGYLLNRIREAGLKDKVNLIFLSDHGYTNVQKPDNLVTILPEDDEMGDSELLTISTGHPVGLIGLPGADVDWDNIYQMLYVEHSDKPVKIWKKSEFPKNLHYANHRRVGEIILEPNFQHALLTAPQTHEYYGSKPMIFGEHGYHPKNLEMNPFFIAHGPSFPKKLKLSKTFENIDLYPLFCEIMGIPTPPNDGNISNVSELIHKSRSMI